MKGTPVGVSALLERMPRWFVEHARKTEERTRRRREAQAKRFELELPCAAEVKQRGWQEWQDTVAEIDAR